MAKTLKQCLQAIGIPSDDERIIHHITHDSRQCSKYSIYCGDQYQQDALNRKAFVVDEKYLGALLNYFYDDPCSHYLVIGVTGTSGKTSVATCLKSMLDQLGYRCIRLGTNYHEMEKLKIDSVNTTMNVMDNLKVFMDYINLIDVIIMEVSSHAIEENRIAFIRFDYIIYTNISPEHMDYHLTFTHYKYSKFKLRHYLKENGRILFHYDHLILHELLIYERERMISYGKKGRFQISSIETSLWGSSFMADGIKFTTTLLFMHIMNLAAVLACLKEMKIDLHQVVSEINQIQQMEGRMEKLIHHDRIFVIDYAHTSTALSLVCSYLQKHKIKRLIGVFGCGGERDRLKRKEMALSACSLCDEVIVTEDNNRNEPFEQIVSDMQLHRFDHVQVIEKRENALFEAFKLSSAHDIILVAGKGCEKFLIANGRKTPYNDKECILKLKEVE